MTGWLADNRRFLEAELAHLRELLRLRVEWRRRLVVDGALPDARDAVVTDAEVDAVLACASDDAYARFLADEGAAPIIEAARRLRERSTEIAAAMTRDSAPPALLVLARALGLSAFERDVLLLCLAPELDLGFERIFAYASDTVARPYPTTDLALALFTGPGLGDPLRARESLAPPGRLRTFHLLTGEGGAPGPAAAQPLRLDDRIALYLQGIETADPRIVELLTPRRQLPLTDGDRQAVVDLVPRVRDASLAEGFRAVNLVGPPNSGRDAVAYELAKRLGLNLSAIDLARLPADAERRRERFRVLEREARLLRLAFYVDLDGRPRTEGAAPGAVPDVVDRLDALVIVASQERVRIARPSVCLRLPGPSARDQRARWEQALGEQGRSLNGQIDSLAYQFDLGAEAIREIAASTPPVLDELWQACREHSVWRVEDLARRVTPSQRWDDIVLPDEVSLQLREVAAQVAHRARVYDDWGFAARMSRGQGISALFAGPSGVGKTMAAEVLARELSLDLYIVDLAGVVSKYIGETEKNLRTIFEAAEAGGAILFFDEADALFSKRTEAKDSNDRYANIEVNYLLQRMEEYRGLAILATNRKSAIDSAFLRRLRFYLDFPFPDIKSRATIWRKAFAPGVPTGALDFDALARLDLAGGSIRNIALNAAFLAAARGDAVQMAHVAQAARREYAKLDKRPMALELTTPPGSS